MQRAGVSQLGKSPRLPRASTCRRLLAHLHESGLVLAESPRHSAVQVATQARPSVVVLPRSQRRLAGLVGKFKVVRS